MSRKQRIYNALFTTLKPDSLLVDDESHLHHVPDGAQTHFKVIAVATIFENLNRVARHRLVNSALSNEFMEGLHALSLHLSTPSESIKNTTGIPTSPACRNGKHYD